MTWIEFDVLAVPDRLEESVREAQVHDVLHGLLPEEVVDAVELLLGHERRQTPVQLARRDEIGSEGLFDDEPCVVQEARMRELLRGLEEARGWDREVEDRELRPLQSRAQLLGEVLVPCVAADVGEPREEGVEDPLVAGLAFRGLDRGARVLLHLVVPERAPPHPDDRAREDPLLREVVQRGEGLRACEIAGDAEDDESVRVRAHEPSRANAAERSMLVPSSRSSTGTRSFAEWMSFVASSGSMRPGKNPYATVPNAALR